MKVRCSLFLSYSDEKEAEKLLSALKVDDDGYVESSQEGSTIRASAEASSMESLLHTLNDYLACLSAAEKLVNQD